MNSNNHKLLGPFSEVKLFDISLFIHVFFAVTFLSSYYILAGVVYQAPDLGSVLNSRLVSTDISAAQCSLMFNGYCGGVPSFKNIQFTLLRHSCLVL